MKIIIPGGSGQVGTILARKFQREGHEVIVLSRSPAAQPWTVLKWDAVNLGPWIESFENADVILNMAGRSVNCRYTAENRRLIKQSRVDSTFAVGQAIEQAANPPGLWLQASTATIYAHQFDAPHDEASGILGGTEDDTPDTWRFSIDVAKSWEAALDSFHLPRTRKVALRSAMTMSADRGGIFEVLSRLARVGLGGPVAGGKQFVSWIHEADFLAAIDWLIDHDDFCAPVNLAAPNPLPYRDFMAALRMAWNIPFGMPATKWMLEIGAFCLRTESELVLKSRRVTPGNLLASGFQFQFPNWPEAAHDLAKKLKDLP